MIRYAIEDNIPLEDEIVGFRIFGSAVDITDPTYERDGSCQLLNVPVNVGFYSCIKWTGEFAWGGRRVGTLGIYLNGIIPAQNEMSKIGEIGVDAGLAGFFNSASSYSYDYEQFGENVYGSGNNHRGDNAWMLPAGFFSNSGFGDGIYDVYAHYTSGTADALEIRFM